MCGIVGFAGFEEPGLLKRMTDVIRHRGPDGEGFFSEPGLSMGNRRLSIIDLEGGWQPIYNEDESLVVCFNGEIYNYVELMEELRERGHAFRTRCDTEVIVHAFEEWGIECLQRFNGMFVFALWDLKAGELILARDRCGQKPLYLWSESGALIFASEVKAILESERVERRCNLPAVDAFLALRYVPEPQTMFAGVRTLPAAHYLRRSRDGQIAIERYWDVPLWEGDYLSDGEYLEQLEEKFFEAIRLTMRSDVPVGAYLSAGVDSSLIAAAMCRHSDRVNTFSIGFHSNVDETAEAAETARLLGTQHHEVYCTPEDFDRLPQIVWHMDRPVGDALVIAFHKLAEATSQHVKVVLGGLGADEMFAGYSFHKLIQLTERYRRLVPGALHRAVAMPLLRATPVRLLDRFFQFPAYLGSRGKARLVDFLAHYSERDLFHNYVSLRTLFELEERRELYSGGMREHAGLSWMPPVRDRGGRFLDRLLKLQYDEWLQDWAIIRDDKNTMAHSLEIRLPFLDHELIELAFRMPPHLKTSRMQDKVIERRLARKLLPPEVVRRPKNPFFLPMEYFYEHPNVRELIRLTLNEEQVRRRGTFDPAKVSELVQRMESREFLCLQQVMSLVILELWHMIFIDKQKLW